MIDPADQKASDEAIKRNTNLTPTEVRQSLNATAIDFQRRVDSAASITPTVSTPSIPAEITSRETKLEGQPVVLPSQDENQNPFPSPQNPPAQTGTSSSPYVMGTDNTQPASSPADDTWDITSPQAGTDGVDIPNIIRAFAGTSMNYSVDKSGGGTYTIGVQPVTLFTRELVFNSVGQLVSVAAENLVATVALTTVS